MQRVLAELKDGNHPVPTLFAQAVLFAAAASAGELRLAMPALKAVMAALEDTLEVLYMDNTISNKSDYKWTTANSREAQRALGAAVLNWVVRLPAGLRLPCCYNRAITVTHVTCVAESQRSLMVKPTKWIHGC